MENLALTMPPVAHTLGALAILLGRHHQAADHFTRAIAIAERWNAAHWTAQARAALATVQANSSAEDCLCR
jgi:uncharacterized protein HemY